MSKIIKYIDSLLEDPDKASTFTEAFLTDILNQVEIIDLDDSEEFLLLLKAFLEEDNDHSVINFLLGVTNLEHHLLDLKQHVDWQFDRDE